MKRRQFFQATLGASTFVFAGCAGFDNLEEAAESNQEPGSSNQNTDGGPDFPETSEVSPEVLELVQSENQLIGTDNPETGEFELTIQNTGVGGNIAVALFWQLQEFGEKPKSVESPLGTEAYRWERTQEFFFNSGERRTVEMTALPPEDAIGFYFLTQPATYGATIRNTGSAGRVRVTMTYTSTGLGVDSTEEQTVFIGEDTSKDVLFNVTIMPETEWKIRAEPVN